MQILNFIKNLIITIYAKVLIVFKYIVNFIKQSWKIILIISLVLNLVLLIFTTRFTLTMQQSQSQVATNKSETTVWNTVENSNLQLVINDLRTQGQLIVTNTRIWKKDFISYMKKLTPIEFITLKRIQFDADRLTLVFLSHDKNRKNTKIKYSVITNSYNTNYNVSLNTNISLFQLFKGEK